VQSFLSRVCISGHPICSRSIWTSDTRRAFYLVGFPATLNGISRQVLITFRQNWVKQEVKHYLPRDINLLILIGARKNCLCTGTSQFTTATELTVVIIEEYHRYQLYTKYCLIFFSQGEVHRCTELLGIISVGFDVTNQLLIRSFAFVRYWRRKWKYTNNEPIRQLFTHFKKAYASALQYSDSLENPWN
jgi:hypothetical protein